MQAPLAVRPTQRQPTENPADTGLSVDRRPADALAFLDQQRRSQRAPQHRGTISGDGEEGKVSPRFPLWALLFICLFYWELSQRLPHNEKPVWKKTDGTGTTESEFP